MFRAPQTRKRNFLASFLTLGRLFQPFYLLGCAGQKNKLYSDAGTSFINDFGRRFDQGDVLWSFLDCFYGARVRESHKIYTHHDGLYPQIMNQ